MSDETTKTATDNAGEEGEPSRIAGWLVGLVLIGVAILALKALVTAFPYVAYYVAGLLTCWGWSKGRSRLTRRADDDQEHEDIAIEIDIAGALRRLSGDAGSSVLLTALRDHLTLPDTKAVKALLDEAGIRHKAVRTPDGNGPGVHVKDIPPVSSPTPEAHDERCCCRSDDNNNADNTPDGDPRKGTRVEAIGDGGLLVSHTCRNRPAPASDDD
ncbi:hypothetical protein [Streptomyces caniscabiei]|uniref:Uncharacterized protein n=1 Tax=Streptomyces caniscabiei TaxID=2746961 RepID=A0ABU4ML30_9ACTN|nr:hypothetical protein [Streptomyces caniscabiei]MBE4790998.1 hypothetical protein [Streptomyces caniscabiei]MDX3009627.1 hypothetical protein [Streptomyces caniscabiei]MDX3037272.1 hypothetical protein [Streptomyces caniscabiei]